MTPEENTMSNSALTMPQEPTWKLLAVSSDMMDTQFCNKRFPFRWRSSLAVSAFEPDTDNLLRGLCEGRITFLKVTATITGYQPSKEETAAAHASFPNVPTEELSRILDQYFGCYGALLNVAVFPNPNRKFMTKRIVVPFDEQQPEALLPNPFDSQGASFEAVGQPNNRVTDVFPAGGDGQGELHLFQELLVTCPATPKVEARVVHFSAAGIEMEAFNGNTPVGSDAAGPEQGQVHQLVVEGEDINRVVFTAPQNDAALLDFAYSTQESRPFDLIEFPHIIDLEPKTRDLVQASTETGEILTSSKSNVKTNKSLTHTESSETGYELGAMYGKKDVYGITGKLNHKNTETEQENWSVATDASRERQEKEGSSTQISQLYNLLSTYHLGTNRALVLMLARPHILQPTDHRTFVDGLRQIEGIQESLLIVARPPDMEGLSIEAYLETGHFPEGLTPEKPEETFDESSEDFIVTAFADNGYFSGSCTNILTTHTVEAGWVVDTRPERGWDAGHPGIQEISNDSNGQANSSLENYNYQRIADAEVQVSGRICGQSLQRDKARFNRTYRVFTRSITPRPSSGEPKVPLDKLLITSRGLCVRFRSGEDCPEIEPFRRIPPFLDPGDLVAARIVDERDIRISPELLTRSGSAETRLPAMKELLSKIRNAMVTSARLPQRRPFDEAPGFLGSEYFKEQVRDILPRDTLSTPLSDVGGLPNEVLDTLGESTTVDEALNLDLARFAEVTGLTLSDALEARRRILGLVELEPKEKSAD
jgi:hypothetical protein